MGGPGRHLEGDRRLAKGSRRRRCPQRPKAIVVISGHWEEPAFTASSVAAPSMIYDYTGFPPHTYELKYPAPGAPGAGAADRRSADGRRPAGADGYLARLRPRHLHSLPADLPGRGHSGGAAVAEARSRPGRAPGGRPGAERAARRRGADRRQRHELSQHARLQHAGGDGAVRSLRSLAHRDGRPSASQRTLGRPRALVGGARRRATPIRARSTCCR